LQTTGPLFILLVTFVATVTATFGRHAILANVRTIFDPGFHFDKTRCDLVVAIIRGVANTNGVTRPRLMIGVIFGQCVFVTSFQACAPLAVFSIALAANISATPHQQAVLSFFGATSLLSERFACPSPIGHLFRGGGRAVLQTRRPC